ncbi:MAG: FAD-dependent thymidylate synthase [Candidatus Sabulitectum sp.]|nr:FAD-dependent thymidylate synthase [Candidatus Sabulitectum sp.]
MKVILAGYNTDTENGSKTPETISAAYARISRDPAPITELRKQSAAEVDQARRSNRTIVYKYGHGSIAEHAVFNFDILGISRLAAEAVQSFRLISFTEKSQRYIRIGEDWVLPEGMDQFAPVISDLFLCYRELLSALLNSGLSKTEAREDARYILPLAATTQMGMTVNARELEHMIKRMKAHPLEEVRSLADALYEAVLPVAPSLMLFTEPTEMDRIAHIQPVPLPVDKAAELLSCDSDERIADWLTELYGESDFERVYSHLGIHDALPRFWELFRADFRITLSATAYAQLKRHRMTTQLVSAYDPALGVTIPPSIVSAGLSDLFLQASTKASATSKAADLGRAGEYLLTNAHRRQVRLSINGREFNHFIRLREDAHAQWDIRLIASEMVSLIREKAPLTVKMTCGKSRFEEVTGKPAQ